MADNNVTNDIFGKRGLGVFPNISTAALISLYTDSTDKPLEVLVTSFSGQVAESYQAMKSFDDAVYITLFGQALNMYTIKCATMPDEDICDDAKSSANNDKGLKDLHTIYKKYRVGNVKRPVIRITMDKMTVHGFLVAMPISTISDQNAMNSIAFDLKILGQMII